MAELVPTALAGLAVVLFGVALFSLRAGNFAVAGMSFMSASLVIYFRETRV